MTTLLELGRSYKELDREQLAGQLVMTSYGDQPANANVFQTLLRQAGLDETLVPNQRSEVLDYQLACRSVETRRGRAASGRQIVTVGEVVTNQVESVYQITAEIRDEANRVIEHAKAMRVIYDHGRASDPVMGGDPIRFEPIDDQRLYHALGDLGDRIKLHFNLHRGKVPGAKVREILRKEFTRMHGTRWRDSVWFIGMGHTDELEKWRQVIKTLNPDATFDVVPLPNTAAVRAQLEEKIGAHVKEDATKLMGEIAKTLGAGKPITAKQFERLSALRAELAENAKAMQDHLGDELSTVSEAMGLLDQQLMEMWGRIA